MRVLGALTGQSFQDNAAVWQRWWTEKDEKLEGIMAALDGDEVVSYFKAMDEAADLGFLLAARHVLQDLGLLEGGGGRGMPASRDTSGGGGATDPGGARAGGYDSPETQRSTACEAVGRTLRNVHADWRDQVVGLYLTEPLAKEQDQARRRELLQILIDVQTESTYRALAQITLGAVHLGSFEQEDRDRALEGLAAGLSNAAVQPLGEVMKRTEEPARALRAVAILQEIDSTKAVAELVEMAGLLDQHEKLQERLGMPVTRAIHQALEEMTGRDGGRQTWPEWWAEHQHGFKTAREKALAENQEVVPGEQKGTSAAFYGIKTRSKRLCFVLDVSGSMNETTTSDAYEQKVQTKIEVAKHELVNTIKNLPDDAWFTIIFYSSGFKMWKPRLVQALPEVRDEAVAWIGEVMAAGATNIFDPLAKAFELAGRGAFDRGYEVALDTIFFLSDGQPTTGLIMDPRKILEELLRLNQLKRVQVNTIGLGPQHDAVFMQMLAEQTGGVYIAR